MAADGDAQQVDLPAKLAGGVQALQVIDHCADIVGAIPVQVL